jgi:hypothetical protein
MQQPAANMAAFSSTFQPVGRTPEDREVQFDRGCAAKANTTKDFWVAVFMLGVGNSAPASLGSGKERSSNPRVLGSLRTVR